MNAPHRPLWVGCIFVCAACSGRILEPPGLVGSSAQSPAPIEDFAEVPDPNPQPRSPAEPLPPPDELPAPEICEAEGFWSAIPRRLTRTEYAHTVRDTLDVDIRDRLDLLPDELRAAGFTNTASALIVSYAHVEAYAELAFTIAERADLAGLIADHASCTDADPACWSSFVESLGAVLFRRPPSPVEAEPFVTLFQAAEQEGDGFDFDMGARLALESMLQSARFLYRLEPHGQVGEAIDGYALASRLSYTLWQSAPDAELLDLAASGKLDEPGTLEAQVDRMLADPRAIDTSVAYVSDWLRLQGLDTLQRDPEEFPGFDSDLAQDMRYETVALVEQLLWDDEAPLMALLTADHTYLSGRLAELYGFDKKGEGVERYELAGTPRAGVLTHAGVLSLMGGAHGSLVPRGLFVLRTIMCSEIPPPPPGVDTNPGQTGPGLTQRLLSEERTGNPSCAPCHAQFDPLAYAFDPFDGIGRWHAEDPHGNALRSDGAFQGAGGEPIAFDSTTHFVQLLATDERVETCVMVKPMQFAAGRPLDAGDACLVAQIRERFETEGGTYQALIRALTLHPAFRLQRAPQAVEPEGGP